MSWDPTRSSAPPPYAYDSYSNPHGPPGQHQQHDHRPVPPHPGTPYSRPPTGSYPTSYSGHPPGRSSYHQMPATPTHDYWYDQNRGPPPSPWRTDFDDSRKLERAPSTDRYQSPDRGSMYAAYYPPMSSSRGGRRPDVQRTPSFPHTSTAYPQPPPSRPPQMNHRGNSTAHTTPKHPDSSRQVDSNERAVFRSTTIPKNSSVGEKEDREDRGFRSQDQRAKKSTKEETTKTNSSDKKKGKKDGDPLSILAQVSSEVDNTSQDGNETENQNKYEKPDGIEGKSNPTAPKNVTQTEKTKNIVSPQKSSKPPTSPIQRRIETSPLITPNMSSETHHSASRPKDGRHQESVQHQSKERVARTLTPKPITPTAAPQYHQYPPKPPHTPPSNHSFEDSVHRGLPSLEHASSNYPYPPHSHSNSFPPPPSYGYSTDSREGSWEYPHRSPAVVEHNSFDSGESGQRYPPDYPYHAYQRPPPPPGNRYYPGENAYPPMDRPPVEQGWYSEQHHPGEKYPETPAPTSPYPHHRWSHEGTRPPSSPMANRPVRYPGPAPPPSHYNQYPHSAGPPPRQIPYPTPSPYYPPPPPEASPYDPAPKALSGRGQPYNPSTPHPMAYPMYHPHQGYPPHAAGMVPPYTYVQQPNQEEKTILRKKFSWKHFPELERFLIDNRDDYLQFSSRNYTVEQKQFNNHLTERLIQLAEKHNYVFDPEDFNFVAIRDRIRCYYKSYVQTARKRGLSVPGSNSSNKRQNSTGGSEENSEGNEDDGHDSAS